MSQLIALTLTLVVALPATSLAAPLGWFTKGVDNVTINAEVTVPLYRGSVLGNLPSVQALVPANGEPTPRQLFAVIDVGHRWTTIGRDTASALGLTLKSDTLFGVWTQTTVIPEVRVGDLVLRGVRAQVVDDHGLRLGMATLPQVAVALLPSEGVVRFVPASDGAALVRSVGEPVPLLREKPGKYKVGDDKVRAFGVQRSLPVSIVGGLAPTDGFAQLRTDRESSALSGDAAYDEQRVWAGYQHFHVQPHLGTVSLADGWFPADDAVVSPNGPVIAALGYDALYNVDLAVSVAGGIAAARHAPQPTWSVSASQAVTVAKEAWKRFDDLVEDEVYNDAPARMGFGTSPAANPEGSRGDPARLARANALGDALWSAGRLDEALPYYLKATESAGDQCEPYLRLGQARLAWSGTLQEQKFIAALIEQPLLQAGALWDRWAALSASERQAARTGGALPAGTFRIEQPSSCRAAWGLLMASHVQRGDTDAASAIYREHAYRDAAVAYAQGLSMMRQQQFAVAEEPLRAALKLGGEYDVDIRMALARATAEQGKGKLTTAWLIELPGRQVSTPLTTALLAVEIAHVLDPQAGASMLATLSRQTDAYGVHAQFLRAFVERDGVGELASTVESALLRTAGSPQMITMHAASKAVAGDLAAARAELAKLRAGRAPVADRFAAEALVAHLAGDATARDAAIRELGLRYPMVFTGQLGLRADSFGRFQNEKGTAAQ